MSSTKTARKYKGTLVGLKVIVWSPEEAKEVYKLGFYGKPFGIRKPKGLEWEGPLELSLLEALYLVEKGILEVEHDGKVLDPTEFKRYCEEVLERFNLLYIVYKDLRDRGYIVRSGLKFGCDFAVYEKGPGIDHAPYLVHVLDSSEKIDPIEIVRAGRLSHSVRKRFIIACTNPKTGSVRYVMFKWYKP